ncbi:uncharacterized protein LOC117106421 [Anneissia japonica]|uniref:uncharacterized protein LOC117106421 n=1 Tax=Anneissia japonica TaxID=1529436 RepID=UPI001425661C|nr:uncharacterized protein LOC117106421 [Anneissia japonica]
MRRFSKFLLFLIWKYSCLDVVETKCPFVCVHDDSNCYLIYTESGKWYYKNAENSPKEIDVHFSSALCYKFIRGSSRQQSAYNAQIECKQQGGNIAVIKNDQQYNQLVESVLQTLPVYQESYFNVHLGEINVGTCAKVSIEDGALNLFNSEKLEKSDCNKNQSINSLMCEATTDLTDTLRPTPKMNLLPTTSKTTADSITNFYVEPMEEDQVKTPRLYILIPLLILVFLIAVSSLFICCQRGMRKRRCSRHNDQLALSGVSDENIKRNDVGDAVQSNVENLLGSHNAVDMQRSGDEVENEYYTSPTAGNDIQVQY